MRETPVRVTPTGLLKSGGGKARQVPRAAGAPERSRLVGTLAHRVLQHWNFSDAPEQLPARIAAACRQEFAEDRAGTAAEIEAELLEMLRAFTASEPYRDLRRAMIIGREVPFVMPWDGMTLQTSNLEPRTPAPCAVMEGVIDVVYRLDGKVHLADYKTDRVKDSEVADRAAEYEGQARVYREALSRCLGIAEVGVQLIFVRNGKAVAV
jgi:ATP-dependent helicase/nuclease subunit A